MFLLYPTKNRQGKQCMPHYVLAITICTYLLKYNLFLCSCFCWRKSFVITIWLKVPTLVVVTLFGLCVFNATLCFSYIVALHMMIQIKLLSWQRCK
jgi:hypothetical protein